MQLAPVIYEHAASLIERSPWDVSRDQGLLYDAHAEAFRTYDHSPVVAGIDIYNVEPEAYGAAVSKPDGLGMPTITGRLISRIDEISNLPRFDPRLSGRMPMVISAAERLGRELGGTDVRVPVSGPFATAAGLMGLEALLCDLQDAPDAVARALERLADGVIDYCREVYHNGLDVIVFESGGAPPMVSPGQFRDVLLPAIKRIIGECGDISGETVPFVIGGDTAAIVPELLATGSRYLICPAETDQAAFMKRIPDGADVTVRMNMAAGVIASGRPEAITAELDRLIALAGRRENVCLGTGVIPYECPPANVIRAMRYVEDATV